MDEQTDTRTDRQTDPQTDRGVDGHTDGWTDGQKDGWTDGNIGQADRRKHRTDGQRGRRTDTRTDGQSDRLKERRMDRWKGERTDRWLEGQTKRRTDRQTDRQTDRWINRTHKEICLRYQLNGTSVPQVNICKYLGIYLSNKLGWEEQITNNTRKAWKTLHFSMRILKKSNRRSKELAYKTLVRPIMEYGAVGWDPYRQNQIDSIEKVQRKAAKYVKMGKGHGEEIVKDLGWEFLKSRRRKTRLTALFKAQMGHNARLVTPSYLGRADHFKKFKCRKQRTDMAKFSFLNRRTVHWNILPAAIFQVGPLKINTFKEKLRKLD
ncbi:hypothetical protein ANN_09377 [Periplaneta americana]|uniref:Uncharacterized protein n=1 Tax=Periplaneta americana TaxID=6978 RepID=A0ABQ8TL65_PERAM|nr:hypothetical protein ANN_09377 [Periplaneta americana]